MGVKTLYEYFYKLAYGAKGVEEHTKYVDNLDVADAEIKANKDARHTKNTDTALATLTVGIPFPATQVPSANANTLDDYEEGEWTPALKFGGNSVGMTATYYGLYTKIGRQVTVCGRIYLTAKGTSEGVATIEALPFIAKDTPGARTAISLRLDKITFVGAFEGLVRENTTIIYLYGITEAGVAPALDDTNFADNSSIIFSATYFTD